MKTNNSVRLLSIHGETITNIFSSSLIGTVFLFTEMVFQMYYGNFLVHLLMTRLEFSFGNGFCSETVNIFDLRFVLF